MSGAINRRCEVCGEIKRCKYMFGRYWADKSRDGTGCTYPLPSRPDAQVRRADPPKEPWQGEVFTARRSDGGVFRPRKRKVQVTQETLL